MAKKVSTTRIRKQLRACEPSLLPEKFVAAAVQLGANGRIHHSAIAVGSEYGKHIFGFNSARIETTSMEYSRMYYQKSFDNVPPHLSEAFYVHCNEAAKNCAPEYGYFYNGTYFKDGKLINAEECGPYRMTCVGFCLAILQGWHTDNGEFIIYEDWNENNSMLEIEAIVEIKKLKEDFPYMEEDELRDGMRRIRPAEYLSCAFVDEIPVTKALIEPIAKAVNEVAAEIAHEIKSVENN